MDDHMVISTLTLMRAWAGKSSRDHSFFIIIPKKKKINLLIIHQIPGVKLLSVHFNPTENDGLPHKSEIRKHLGKKNCADECRLALVHFLYSSFPHLHTHVPKHVRTQTHTFLQSQS